jgi:hypothetical protein
MKTLIIKGARKSTLSIHRCETDEELKELEEVYAALGYGPEALVVEEDPVEKAA